ncbi:hypothetical protein [Streptomyces boncukensis]|uniref:Uncharacterized protein n=1 Tax=Streptomyces boncukensis TaxID=2711219 RepID=A0A6G4WTE5_9ACTN|nr:hypothetical protein [Streptomyces boncukensis]NGO67897.1 hypothetical protein [Streptomyces boncukensis]
MATTRARKTSTGKAAPEDAPTEATAPTGTDTTPTPDAAPLEPPHIEAAPESPEPSPYATSTEVIPDNDHLADVILDDATGLPPADPEAVFAQLTPFGSSLTCTVRLVERTFLGPHRNPVTRLLQPQGAVVSEQIAARIRERLVAQATRSTSEQ